MLEMIKSRREQGEKGFTLAELLIVVAIIAVLIAIAIPVFTTQLERSRESTDLSNIRAAYAEAMADYLSDGAKAQKTATVSTVKQTTSGWVIEGGNPVLKSRVNGVESDITLPSIAQGSTVTVTVAADGTCTVTATAAGE